MSESLTVLWVSFKILLRITEPVADATHPMLSSIINPSIGMDPNKAGTGRSWCRWVEESSGKNPSFRVILIHVNHLQTVGIDNHIYSKTNPFQISFTLALTQLFVPKRLCSHWFSLGRKEEA
jgi:hypothetical protein